MADRPHKKFANYLIQVRNANNSGLKAIIFNTGWLFADRILRMGFGLIVGVWIARYLGVQQFGIFNYASAFAALFSPIATMGLDGIVIKEIVRYPTNKEEILGTTFCLKLIGAISCLLLTILCILVFRHNDSLTVWLVAILAFAGVFQAFDTIDLWFQSQVQSKYSVLAKNTAFVVITILKVTLVTMKVPLIAFAWAALAEFAVGALGLVITYRVKGFSIWQWRWSFPMAKSFIRQSFPLIFSGLSIMIYLKIDQIMLGEMVSEAAVGIYSAATRISEVWYFIPMAVASSVSPSIYAAKKTDEALYYRILGNLHRLLFFVSIVVSLPMTFISETIITSLFGNAYADAGGVLAIHIWASVFVFMGVATSSWFIAEGLTQFSMYRTLIGAITNIVLNLFLIPAYAGVGAAIATVISYGMAGFFIHAIYPKTWKIFQMQIKSLIFY
jgi:PST family polysaccharide transporter